MLIRCCGCGNTLSADAANCPLCGFEMRAPAGEAAKEQNARNALNRARLALAGALAFLLLCATLSVWLIGSAIRSRNARDVEGARRRSAAVTQAPRGFATAPPELHPEEMYPDNSDFNNAVLVSAGSGIAAFVLLFGATRNYRWHRYRYNKFFGHLRRGKAVRADQS